jgi:hypothetical protein
MRNFDACLYVRPDDRLTLERLVADGNSPQKLAARARIVLLSGRGFGNDTGKEYSCSPCPAASDRGYQMNDSEH